MGLFSKLFGKKDKEVELTDEQIIEGGACPNCWGQSEYGGQYKAYVYDQTKANINHDKLHQKAFIQQFVETNVTGIRLKKDGDKYSCPACKSSFEH